MRCGLVALTIVGLLLVPVGAARQPVRARHGMVVAMESIAVDVGVSVLQRGGNAVDAAVAVGFALAVTHPFAGNLGGGGYMLIRMTDGRTGFIDFRERAPAAASRDMYLDADGNATRDSIEGWRSSGVPGTVRGFEMALSKYGRTRWTDALAPSVDLASKGFPVSYALAESLRGSRSLARDAESKRIFLKDGTFFEPGDTLAQPELAATLRRLQSLGPDEFYEGETARRLADEMAAHGGIISRADLASYKAVERAPLQGSYREFTILTAPPSSSGGVALLEMLGILEGTDYSHGGAGSASVLHYEAEAMRRAYADRNEYLGDPDFVKVPIASLLDRAYLSKLRSTIDPERATASVLVHPGNPAGVERPEHAETTHFSVVDQDGNAVAVTYTLNGGYGNGITVPGLGFLLNNEMDDFSSKPGTPNMFGLVQGEANVIAPGKRPLSSMTPTIVLKDNRLFMTLGAPGGSRISTAVLQVLLNVVDFGMNVQDAIDAPRIHHQWLPDKLSVERGVSPDTVALLRSRGYDVDDATGVVLAQVAAILSEGGWLEGGSDGRTAAGKAAGY
jgi:gamma-glutamyltranspeptidase/glutathione hydrolase